MLVEKLQNTFPSMDKEVSLSPGGKSAFDI